MAREFANTNPIENVWNIKKKEIGNQMLCKKEDMWKRVCEAWYRVAPNILEELYNLITRRIADFYKRKGRRNEILTLRCKRTRMLLRFHWNALKYVVVFLLECIRYLYTHLFNYTF